MAEHNDLGPTGAGSVVANIGGDRGALVLYTPESMVGAEIEVSLAAGGVRTHVAVRERRAGAERQFAAFYPTLVAGEYVVWDASSRPTGMVTIVGGEVAELSVRITDRARGQHHFSLSPGT
ncbi:MAG: phospholipase [Candidatus Dormibacteraeota bacterium]|uniref:Phospholipase n=1 Tax=Candidatus Aeolococcus gillhamiae TaxID=3127015 RepID=A0A2W5ZMY0_9BACT|nr:phospholipase [Candidatus Dormibacteraeota bacterium]PZR84196.1 MAG: phospholipase [Candidatus Dormibacter sp. RRmetagenome_bin12]